MMEISPLLKIFIVFAAMLILGRLKVPLSLSLALGGKTATASPDHAQAGAQEEGRYGADLLVRQGKIVAVAPDDVGFPALGYGDALPRVQAIVRLDDGIHLMVDIIQVADPAEVQPGDRVRMVLRKHKREDSGAWVYGYGFVKDEG